MNRDLLIARLMAMRATIDAWILEATEGEASERCCDDPSIKVEETYGSSRSYCASCGTESSKAGSEKVSGQQQST